MQRSIGEPCQTPLRALFFLSGISALSYEVIWTRTLALVFGVTAYAVATVLAAYMGGLALGSYLSGRLADGRRRPLRDYGLIELGVGATCLALLLGLEPIAHLREALMRSFYVSGELTVWRYLGLKFLISFLLFLLPTTLMGGTFPVVNRIVSRHPGNLGRSLGRIYAANTIGAIAGALLAGPSYAIPIC
jgi:spermidine synthase